MARSCGHCPIRWSAPLTDPRDEENIPRQIVLTLIEETDVNPAG
jgi:hypothetical protein